MATLLVLTACVTATEHPRTCCGLRIGAFSEAQQEDPLYVVVTTTILGDIVKSLVGDDGQVEVLLPIGADPHDFQLSSQDGVKIREADLVVANGLGLEESFMAVFESAREDGARILEVGDLADPMEWGEGRGGHDEEEGEEEKATTTKKRGGRGTDEEEGEEEE